MIRYTIKRYIRETIGGWKPGLRRESCRRWWEIKLGLVFYSKLNFLSRQKIVIFIYLYNHHDLLIR